MKYVDFGFEKIRLESKQPRVNKVFNDVANNYNIMNDIMSFGLHHSWKKAFVNEITVGKNAKVLDLAGGTGDISKAIKKKHPTSKVFLTDINEEMLKASGVDEKDGIVKKVANAENLPFDDEEFDYVVISFGLRNVPNKEKALKEAYRVLKQGGKFCCLEFSNVENSAVKKLYETYSFNIIPKIGKFVSNSEEAYRYLVESIKVFPTAEQLKNIMNKIGFSLARYHKLTFGIVAIHTGYKLN